MILANMLSLIQELKDIFVRLSKKYRLAVCSNATPKFVDKSLALQKLDMFELVKAATEHKSTKLICITMPRIITEYLPTATFR